MNFLNTILEKLHLKKPDAASASSGAATAAAPAASAGSTPKGNYEPMSSSPTPVAEVDVVKHLDQLAKGTDMDWKVSIVDMLKLLNIDSSREARNQLAKELNCPADLMSDSAKMNIWLHKTVLQKIAENGGNIPQSLLK